MVSRQRHPRRRPAIRKIVAVAAVVLTAVGIVLLKPRGDSATQPSGVSSPRPEVRAEGRFSEPVVSAPPVSRPEVVTEERPTKPEASSPPPAKPEVKPPVTPPPQTKLPVLLDIGSTTCIPCKRMAPILEEIKEEYQGVIEVKFIDIYKDRYAARKYRIMVIPTQIFYDHKGKEFHRHLGFMGKEEILEVFRKIGMQL